MQSLSLFRRNRNMKVQQIQVEGEETSIGVIITTMESITESPRKEQ